MRANSFSLSRFIFNMIDFIVSVSKSLVALNRLSPDTRVYLSSSRMTTIGCKSPCALIDWLNSFMASISNTCLGWSGFGSIISTSISSTTSTNSLFSFSYADSTSSSNSPSPRPSASLFIFCSFLVLHLLSLYMLWNLQNFCRIVSQIFQS